MSDYDFSHLSRLSRVMAWLSTAGAVLSPLVVAGVYLFPALAKSLDITIDQAGAYLTPSVPLGYRLAAMAFSLAAEGFTVWALWSLRSLFFGYARGEVFTPRALSLINTVAVALFAGVVVSFVVHAPVSLLLSWPRGADHRAVSLGFGTNDLATLFCAGAVLVIARVMMAAHRIADENAKFV